MCYKAELSYTALCCLGAMAKKVCIVVDIYQQLNSTFSDETPHPHSKGGKEKKKSKLKDNHTIHTYAHTHMSSTQEHQTG